MENDYYNISDDWAIFKESIEEADKYLREFMNSVKKKTTGIVVRKKIIKLKKQIQIIRKKINKQKQDYDSDYY